MDDEDRTRKGPGRVAGDRLPTAQYTARRRSGKRRPHGSDADADELGTGTLGGDAGDVDAGGRGRRTVDH